MLVGRLKREFNRGTRGKGELARMWSQQAVHESSRPVPGCSGALLRKKEHVVLEDRSCTAHRHRKKNTKKSGTMRVLEFP